MPMTGMCGGGAEAGVVGVDRRVSGHGHAHVAGLRRLSARANNATTPRSVRFSFAQLACSVAAALSDHHVPIAGGLSDEEFVKVEASFGFTFPPDLKAILQEGLPVGSGFPDWRSASAQQLRLRLNLPIAGLSYEVSRGRFWTKQWGPQPADTENAVRIARAALRKAPILIPVFDHCYIPASPSLAGNPVFFVCQDDVFLCAFDLDGFFEQSGVSPCGQAPLHRRVTSSDADWCDGKVRSFRTEKAKDATTVRRDAESWMDMAMQRQGSDQKWAEVFRKPDAWGRKLDLLAKGAGHSPKVGQKRVHDLHMESPGIFTFSDFYTGAMDNAPRSLGHTVNKNKFKVAGSYLAFMEGTTIHGRSGSGISLADFALKTNSATPKAARWIEFWSSLAEKRQNVGEGVTGFVKPFRSPSKSDVKISDSVVNEDSGSGCTRLLGSQAPQWLAGFLEEMAEILRQGGWNEEDITEAFTATSSTQGADIFLDSQSILEELVLHFNLLSNSLGRAGWTAQEVSEALDVGLLSPEDRRRPNRIPSHLSPQITKLAEYITKA